MQPETSSVALPVELVSAEGAQSALLSIAEAVIAGWTGIPIGKMLADEAYAVRTLGQRLGQPCAFFGERHGSP